MVSFQLRVSDLNNPSWSCAQDRRANGKSLTKPLSHDPAPVHYLMIDLQTGRQRLPLFQTPTGPDAAA